MSTSSAAVGHKQRILQSNAAAPLQHCVITIEVKAMGATGQIKPQKKYYKSINRSVHTTVLFLVALLFL